MNTMNDRTGEQTPESLLESIELLADPCRICPVACGARRSKRETGKCGAKIPTRLAYEGVLYGEEIELIPTHEIFLEGCNLTCPYCSLNGELASDWFVDAGALAEIICSRTGQALNVHFVGGEPTVHLPLILQALARLCDIPPVVWNSNAYIPQATLDLLFQFVDTFVWDLRFGSDDCSERLGGRRDYLDFARNAIVQSLKKDENAEKQKPHSVFIRHLLTPGHVECCAIPTLDWIRAHLPDRPLNLLLNYQPFGPAASDPILGRTPTREEITRTLQHAERIGVPLKTLGG